MLSDSYLERISEDWLWREKEFRATDALLLKRSGEIEVKSSILIAYAHWEGHFKFCATELLNYITECINRKIFKWTDVQEEVRQRLLFCSFRKSNIGEQRQEKFIYYLNSLHDAKFSEFSRAVDEIVLVDDNLNSMKAEAICRNLGVEPAWCILKKITIDERIVAYRNAIAHGSRRLRSGDEIDLSNKNTLDAIDEIKNLIRETKNRFSNAILLNVFIKK